ncbi:MAG: glycine oxidase ThiO [Planctomycetes bacterium]|nr:glycine oxidase ThiO [Planctomycetota bacterium]
MSPSPRGRQAVVIGGGVIGLSVARSLAAEGWGVTVLEKGDEPGQEASSAAAGMLAPLLELEQGSEVLDLGLRSRALYPAWVRELEAETGISVDLRLDGILALPAPGGPGAAPPTGALRLAGPALREAEPALAPEHAEAWLFPDDGSVDPRALVQAILASARNRGAQVLTGVDAAEVLTADGRVTGVRTSGGTALEADAVVLCAGAWASLVRVPGLQIAVRPVKGQMALLDTSAAPGASPRRVVYSHHAYLVPRSDGRLVAGTTVEDRGFDKTVEAGAVARLLEGAFRLCPSLRAARFAEAWAGLRPLGETPAPRIGPAGPGGFFLAVGHYRNGILLAPVTAERVVDAILGRADAEAP